MMLALIESCFEQIYTNMLFAHINSLSSTIVAHESKTRSPLASILLSKVLRLEPLLFFPSSTYAQPSLISLD